MLTYTRHNQKSEEMTCTNELEKLAFVVRALEKLERYFNGVGTGDPMQPAPPSPPPPS